MIIFSDMEVFSFSKPSLSVFSYEIYFLNYKISLRKFLDFFFFFSSIMSVDCINIFKLLMILGTTDKILF